MTGSYLHSGCKTLWLRGPGAAHLTGMAVKLTLELSEDVSVIEPRPAL